MFYFRRDRGSYLLTNDWGHFARLSEKDFKRLLADKLKPKDALWRQLQAKGFIRDHLDFNGLVRDFRGANSYLFRGPSLHILVATLRCNHACLYCQSGAEKLSRTDTDMSLETAKAAVDFVFQSPSPDLTIEFQGGEPLLNWPVVQFAIRYARARNAAENRKLHLALVSNLSVMDEAKLKVLLDHEVSLCTSLDGPAGLHDRNRAFSGGSSHERVERWIGEIMRRHDTGQAPHRKIFKPSALMTATRLSLPHWREIVDEYARLRLQDVFLRPLSPIGHARRVRDQLGYAPAEYLEFYRRALDYILELNASGTRIVERGSAILLARILQRRDPGFVDLRSPCGAAVGQLAFDHDGGIYTCDEGRMVARQGDPIFRLGRLGRTSYRELLSSPACRVVCAASNLDGQPSCSRCVYKPYCGVCPVHSYETQGSLWGLMPAADYCAIRKGMFDILFERIDRPRSLEIFEDWLRPGQGEEHDRAERPARA